MAHFLENLFAQPANGMRGKRAALLLILGLQAIGFIHVIFAVILSAIALTTGAFQLGLVWRTLQF